MIFAAIWTECIEQQAHVILVAELSGKSQFFYKLCWTQMEKALNGMMEGRHGIIPMLRMSLCHKMIFLMNFSS